MVILVDVLQTIGQEVYTNGNRLSIRDGTGGNAEEDSVWINLTTGFLLLHVTTAASSRSNKNHDDAQGETKVSGMPNITVDKDTLQLIQLDYHGEIDNLSTCTLRCPAPKGTTLADYWDRLVVTPKD
mmetsp:Transcript_54662/g.63906  ORF Transcript_54662/g.63906 Transcript_54662/m.63906 type:complete len:127 (+) Transcript_54662:196-576(+)